MSCFAVQLIRIKDLEERLVASKAESDRLNNEIIETELRLQRAKDVAKGLGIEAIRWNNSKKTLENAFKNVKINSLFAAGININIILLTIHICKQFILFLQQR